jgi:hypothetical protein
MMSFLLVFHHTAQAAGFLCLGERVVLLHAEVQLEALIRPLAVLGVAGVAVALEVQVAVAATLGVMAERLLGAPGRLMLAPTS